MRGFQRGIPDVKVRGSRSGLAGTRGLQASHLAKKTINNGASGALVHRCSGGLVHHCLWCIGDLVHWCILRRPALHVAPACSLRNAPLAFLHFLHFSFFLAFLSFFAFIFFVLLYCFALSRCFFVAAYCVTCKCIVGMKT